MNSNNDLKDLFERSRASFESRRADLDEAYQRGFRAGAEAMRSSILRAVELPVPMEPPQFIVSAVGTGSGHATAKAVSRAMRRAPRGLLEEVVRGLLKSHPRQTLRELQTAISDTDPRIALKSIYNHLWSNEGKKYLRDGDRWSLIEADS